MKFYQMHNLGRYVSTQDLEKADLIFNSLGVAQQVPEKMINSIGALAGSGPAYVIKYLHRMGAIVQSVYLRFVRFFQIYLVIEALADGAVKQGIPRKMAIQFAAQTTLGAAKMVLHSGKHPAALKDEVRTTKKN